MAACDSRSCPGIAGTSLSTLLVRLFLAGSPEMPYGLAQFLLDVGIKGHIRC
jgi:hypothetical protein